MTLTLDGRSSAGGFARAPGDHYPTLEPLSEQLPQLEPLGPRVWEPACGDGKLVRVLQAAGISVIATDKLAWGHGREGVDFLKQRRLLAPVVVTNAPFDQWDEFARHAIALGAEKVVLLGRTLLQEGQERGPFFDRHLLHVHQSRRRVNLLPSDQVKQQGDKGHNTKIAYAWYVLVQEKPPELGTGWITTGFLPRLVSRPRKAVSLAR